MKKREKRFLKVLIPASAMVFAAVLFLELFVLNFTSLRQLFGGYETRQLEFAAASHTENALLNPDGSVTLTEGYSSIEFSDINIPVGAITLDVEMSQGFDEGRLFINYTDETASIYRDSWCFYDFIEEKTASNTIVCNFSGDVDKLIFDMSLSPSQSLTIKSITLNEPRSTAEMTAIIIIAFVIIAGAAALIFVFAGMRASREPFEKRRLLCTNAVMIITLCVMLFATSLSVLYTDKPGVVKDYSFTASSGNQITQDIVDAFANGQVSLIEEPGEELLALENPYDSAARQASGAKYLWDHCLYNGKYYSYYGIGPVLALFLPYYMATGYYFPSVWATLLFSLIGILFLTRFYMLVIDKWFKKLPVGAVLMGLITVQMASGIFFSAARPLFYEIAISSGFACITAGASFLISSNILGEGKISYFRLCLSSVFLGYAVLCRPTLAVYCVAALLFMAVGLKKALRGTEKKSCGFVKYAAAALIPFAVFGLAQMVYNYLRFDNPLDFGIQYSLTINDFTNARFHWKFVLINIWAYLFNMPVFSPEEFPFLKSSVETFGLNGYIFIDDRGTNLISVGMVFRALPVLSYFFAGKALRQTDKAKRPAAALLIGVSCLLMPLVIIFLCWESGYAVRYNADFSWQLIMGALVIAFSLYQNCKKEGVKRLLNAGFVISTLLCVYVNAAQIYSFLGMELYL